jgi:hypothetical protein
MAKVSIQFPISEEQKAHVESYAAEQGISTAELIRRALASWTGYDLSADVTARKTKYASPEERVRHQRAMNKARSKRNSQVLKLIAEGKIEEARELAVAPVEEAPYNPGIETQPTGNPSMANDPRLEPAEGEEPTPIRRRHRKVS